MVLNITSKPFERFTAMQILALNGEQLEHRPVETVEQFEQFYDTLQDVSKVIVDGDNFMLANDIINFVSCPVVTLHIETFVDSEQVNFIEYDTEENF